MRSSSNFTKFLHVSTKYPNTISVNTTITTNQKLKTLWTIPGSVSGGFSDSETGPGDDFTGGKVLNFDGVPNHAD